ncbi:nucleotide exchange factor GrpE [Candidatus Poribacteria bacterium]|nr:nucleotide exchange factor GrpE [Candidatus Poribacteria bacterium]
MKKEKDKAKEIPIDEENAEIEESAKEADEEGKSESETDQEIAQMQQELEQADNMMLRLAAELDNYKKRVAKERESLVKYAAQEIIVSLLPVLDNFERAIESADKSKDFKSFLDGVKMIYKSMYDALERKGVCRIDAVGEEFDPNVHEAVTQIDSEKYPENTVAQELQKGYMLHDRVIRPAMVAVSKGSPKEDK